MSNLALLTSIPTTACSAICLPPPPGSSLPCIAIRTLSVLTTVRALTWRPWAWRPCSPTVSHDFGGDGLPRPSFFPEWTSSDKIQGVLSVIAREGADAIGAEELVLIKHVGQHTAEVVFI